MALQTTANIKVDFYDKKYVLINAKQFDKNSRFLSVTCYNHGEIYHINKEEHSAYIRYRKADNNSVFNFCDIDSNGNIIVELTEQMLAADGICCADLVIVNKGDAKVDTQTGEIINIENSSVLSTMPLHFDVTETAIENSDIESSYEFDGLNATLERAEASYAEVILTSKSWAVGDTGIRDNENIDNSKYYAEQSSNSADDANISALNAKNSETLSEEHMNNSLVYSQNSQTYMNNASVSETNAKISEENSKTSEINSKASETNAKASEVSANQSEQNAKSSEINAYTSEVNSKTNEINSLDNANKAQSYAVGGTGTRGNEDSDNAHYYYELIKNIVIGLDTGFIPMGTISFSELATVEKATGYVYNIRDDFITNSYFAEGEGKSYTAGTNVYCRSDGLWDCFGGAASPTATVDEVLDYLGIKAEVI